MFGEQVVGDVTAEPTLVDSWDSVRGQSWSTDRSQTRNADAVWGPLDAPARSSQSVPPRGPAASVADSAEDSGSEGTYDGRSLNHGFGVALRCECVFADFRAHDTYGEGRDFAAAFVQSRHVRVPVHCASRLRSTGPRGGRESQVTAARTCFH